VKKLLAVSLQLDSRDNNQKIGLLDLKTKADS
jgi:hypothetical protein